MKKILNLVAALAGLALGMTVQHASGFTPGNIIIYRVGDGTQVLTNTQNTLFLDEYTTNGTYVSTLMMPTNYFGANAPLISFGSGFAEGEMTLSQNGQFLVVPGFGAYYGQNTNFSLVSQDASTQVPRVVGLVDGAGHINTTTVQTNALVNLEEIRSAASTDGTNLWFSGDTSGIKFTTVGSSLAAQVVSSPGVIRQLQIVSNQLYFTTSGGISSTTNNPLPTVTDTLVALLPGTATNNTAPFGFAFFNLTGGPTPDTLYVNEGTLSYPSEGTGAIVKYSLVGGTNWVNNGSLGCDNAYGLTGVINVYGTQTNVTLFITSGGTASPAGASKLTIGVDSSGYNNDPGPAGDLYGNTVTILPPGITAGTINIRGIAMAPVGSQNPFTGPAQLSVGPITDVFLNHAFTGGPFTFTKNYSVANLGASTMTWGVSSPSNWVSFSSPGGMLAPGGSITVTVSFNNANANSLLPGTNLTSITFTNSTGGNNGFDVTSRPVTLILSQLSVTPSTNYTAVGPVGGPYTPSSKVYNLTNGSASSVTWGASALSSNWITLSATGGTLAPGGNTNIAVSVTNANALALSRGAFVDTVAFTNANVPDPGNGFRSVSLIIGGGFTSNNLVIYRAGDGTATLSNHGTPAFVDEYTRSGVLIESIPISTNNYACSGVATAEGLMTRSTDKQYLVFVGYGTNATYISGSVATSTTPPVPRVVGRVDGNGNVDVTTRLTDFASGTNPRAAVSTNGVDMWVAGAGGGIRHTSLGRTNSDDVCTNPVANFRALNIFSNQLYASSASGAIRVGAVGSGLPTSDTTIVNLPGYSTTEVSPYNFVLFKTQAGGAASLDTLYVADDQGNSGSIDTGLGAVYKWSLVGGTWTSNGFVNIHAVRGLAGDVSIVNSGTITTTNVNLFAVGSQNNASGTLTAYTDSNGWNAPPTGNGGAAGAAIATASANERWDSISLAPEIPTTANISVSPGDFIVTDMPSTVTTNSKTYVVANTSDSSLTWTATWSSAWLSLSTYGATSNNFPAGANTNVVVSFNANATALANGTYLDTIVFSNKVNNQGTTVRNVSLTITGSMAVADSFTTWQNQYFGNTGSLAAAGADPYGKGMINTNQFLAGFDPTNRAAYVHITAISKTNSGTDVRVDYLGASGNTIAPPNYNSRTNVLEFTTNTTSGSYSSNNFISAGQTNILSGGTGAGTLATMVDPGGATNKPSRYYRVRVLVP